ncbi:MAG: hypothetical protein WC919_05445 [Candidatus Paceibacterota bacterium]|jgi:hypothetical protein
MCETTRNTIISVLDNFLPGIEIVRTATAYYAEIGPNIPLKLKCCLTLLGAEVSDYRHHGVSSIVVQF